MVGSGKESASGQTAVALGKWDSCRIAGGENRRLTNRTGAPATVLYSAASDPTLTAPRGNDVIILRVESLADLPVDEVARSLGFAS